MRELLQAMSSRRSSVRLVLLAIAITLVFAALIPNVLFSQASLTAIGLGSAEIILLATAISVSMLTAGIDLSVVATANLCAVAAALVMRLDATSPVMLLAGILMAYVVALACGLLNGLIIARLNAPPILVTLGTSQLFTGLALVASQNTVLKGLPAPLTNLGSTAVLGVPVVLWIAIAVVCLVAVLVSRTKLGVQMRLIGSNTKAAGYSGIPVNRVLMKTYLITALISATAGLVIAAKTQGANPNYGATYVLLAVVIAVLAGTDPDGGRIAVVGVLIATFALQVAALGFTTISVERGWSNAAPNMFQVFTGAMLVGVMLLGLVSDRRLMRRQQRTRLADLQVTTERSQ